MLDAAPGCSGEREGGVTHCPHNILTSNRCASCGQLMTLPVFASGSGSTTSAVTELVVSPAMLEAGLAVLEQSGRLDTGYLVGSDEYLVRDIFSAMWRAA